MNSPELIVVQQSCVPRFVYTAGLTEVCGLELIISGASFYMLDEVIKIVGHICNNLPPQAQNIDLTSAFFVESLGKFTLRKSHFSWNKTMLLKVASDFDINEVVVFQIVPDIEHMTIDVPDQSAPWNAGREPVWQWLKMPWVWPIEPTSTAVTNLAALRGKRITEASHWEPSEWELFAGSGPDTPEDELRVIPVATLLAADPSLKDVISLQVGESLWRESDELKWHHWK
jgi:hypothetical protein